MTEEKDKEIPFPTYRVGDKVRRHKEDHMGMKVGDEDIIIGVYTAGKSIILKNYGTGHDPRNLELVQASEEAINNYSIY